MLLFTPSSTGHHPTVSLGLARNILSCVDAELINGIRDGSNRFICFECREDVKFLMRDLSTGRSAEDRKKKDPVPKFFLESIYRMSESAAPKGHYQAMLSSLLKNADLTHNGTLGNVLTGDIKDCNANEVDVDPFLAVTDVDQESHRLVMWPDKDQIVNYEQGKRFFGVSTTKKGDVTSSSLNTEFETIPNCGHVFHEDGTFILDLIRSRVKAYLVDFFSAAITLQN